MTQHVVVSGTLASDVANAGTVAISYPARELPERGNYQAGDFYAAMDHRFIVNGQEFTFPVGVGVTLNNTTATITNNSGATWAAGSTWRLMLEIPGGAVHRNGGARPATGKRLARTSKLLPVLINLGQPLAAATTAVCAAQAISGTNVAALINGTRAAGGVFVADVPRNLTMVSASAGDTTQTVTATGTDEYGQAMTETRTLNGTTPVVFLKAFARVTSIRVSATMAGNLSVGCGVLLGLPVFVPSVAHITTQLLDGAVATAGTFVAGIRTNGGSTATTGDVRGTMSPNSAPDGARVFQLICNLADPEYIGIPQA